jgi:uncharacterized protein YbjQ (UPF0145 family)
MPGVYTTGTYDTAEWEPIDIVTVSHNESISAIRGIGVDIGQLFGGKSELLEKKIKDLREAIIKEAEKLIKDSDHIIVGLDIETSQYERIFIVVATGTLLRRRKRMGGGKRTTRRKH